MQKITHSNASLKKHLIVEHKISPFSTYLKEIVYGATDGIVTTFAVVAGFNGAQHTGVIDSIPLITVLLFGTANLFADGVSMALGNFLSVRANQDVYRSEKNKELYEIRNASENEKKETRQILQNKGFTKGQAYKITELYAQNESYWLDFMMNKELELPNPEKDNPFYTSLATFAAFVSFGVVPLLPYILHFTRENRFTLSIGFTLLALFLLGLLRFKVTRENIVRSVGEIMLLGSTSAIIAYLVGTLFR